METEGDVVDTATGRNISNPGGSDGGFMDWTTYKQYNVSLIDLSFLSDGLARFFDTASEITSPILDEVKDYWWVVLLAFFAYKMSSE